MYFKELVDMPVLTLSFSTNWLYWDQLGPEPWVLIPDIITADKKSTCNQEPLGNEPLVAQ